MKSLFGDEIPDTEVVAHSPYQQFKQRNCYRKAIDKNKCCKKCWFLEVHSYSKNYYKCKAMGTSCSAATDIRLSYVCNKFQEAK